MLDSYFILYSPLSDRLDNFHSICTQLPFPISLVTERDLTIDIPPPAFTTDCLLSQISPIYSVLLLHQLFLGTPNKPSLSSIKSRYLTYLCDAAQRHLFFTSILRQAESSFSSANLELCQQHYEAINRFYSSSNESFCLILEDDSIFTQNHDYLRRILIELDDNHTTRPLFLDISNSLSLDSLYKNKLTRYSPDLLFYQVLCGQTRCSSAYILNKPAAKLILESTKFLLPIDWHLSYTLSVSSIPTYWTCNPLFLQGSQDASFASNMSSRNS